eukprot:3568884-Amphidinium_carterae.1
MWSFQTCDSTRPQPLVPSFTCSTDKRPHLAETGWNTLRLKCGTVITSGCYQHRLIAQWGFRSPQWAGDHCRSTGMMMVAFIITSSHAPSSTLAEPATEKRKRE